MALRAGFYSLVGGKRVLGYGEPDFVAPPAAHRHTDARGYTVEVGVSDAIHAYVVVVQLYRTSDPLTAEEKEELLGPDWAKAFDDDQGHNFMSDNFRDQMVETLQAYVGPNNFGSQFFNDMVWKGLTNFRDEDGNAVEYQFFKDEITSATKRERIKNTIQVEQYGRDRNGDPGNQKGEDAGC